MAIPTVKASISIHLNMVGSGNLPSLVSVISIQPSALRSRHIHTCRRSLLRCSHRQLQDSASATMAFSQTKCNCLCVQRSKPRARQLPSSSRSEMFIMTLWAFPTREPHALPDLLTLGAPEIVFLITFHAAPPRSMLCLSL